MRTSSCYAETVLQAGQTHTFLHGDRGASWNGGHSWEKILTTMCGGSTCIMVAGSTYAEVPRSDPDGLSTVGTMSQCHLGLPPVALSSTEGVKVGGKLGGVGG